MKHFLFIPPRVSKWMYRKKKSASWGTLINKGWSTKEVCTSIYSVGSCQNHFMRGLIKRESWFNWSDTPFSSHQTLPNPKSILPWIQWRKYQWVLWPFKAQSSHCIKKIPVGSATETCYSQSNQESLKVSSATLLNSIRFHGLDSTTSNERFTVDFFPQSQSWKHVVLWATAPPCFPSCCLLSWFYTNQWRGEMD